MDVLGKKKKKVTSQHMQRFIQARYNVLDNVLVTSFTLHVNI